MEPKANQGVHRVNMIDLALELNIKPYQVPRILYAIQHDGSGRMSYEVDQKSYVV